MFVSYHFNGWARIWQGSLSLEKGFHFVQAGQGLVRVALSGGKQGRLRRSLSLEEGLHLVHAGGGLVRVALSGGESRGRLRRSLFLKEGLHLV